MARDEGLEELLRERLGAEPGLTEKAMFGGRAWLLNGHLMCGARDDGMLVRLGAGEDGWALATPGVDPMISRGRLMRGWVRAGPGRGPTATTPCAPSCSTPRSPSCGLCRRRDGRP